VESLESIESSCSVSKRLAINRYLSEYSKACTAGIMNVACNDCGLLADNCIEEDFSAVDLLDPEYPITGCDGSQNVGEYLASYTSSRIETVVSTLLAMEKCWEKRITQLDVKQYVMANRLWVMGRFTGMERVNEVFGPDMAAEFMTFGEDLFGK